MKLFEATDKSFLLLFFKKEGLPCLPFFSESVSLPNSSLVIHDNGIVWTSELDGQIADDPRKGLMFRDTRLISGWRITADGEPWDLLSAGAIAPFAAKVFLVNRRVVGAGGVIPPKTLSLMLGRHICGGVHEDLELTNHAEMPIRLTLAIAIGADFADVFEVKGSVAAPREGIETVWSPDRRHLGLSYTRADFHRGLGITVETDAPVSYAGGRLAFDVALAPGATWRASLLYDLIDGDTTIAAPRHGIDAIAGSPPARRLADWRAQTLHLQSGNDAFTRLYNQAIDDMGALRLGIAAGEATHVVPAAGLPWFMVLFGRDSIIASMQTGLLGAEFAEGTLALLGASQAREHDAYRDAEPGKIMHEIRQGEMAHFKRIPHTPYYGTADATALYLMLLHDAWRWTGSLDLVRRHLDTAERCLGWIDADGDSDGDGFQEYQTRSPAGYENMAWKDADDAVRHADGSLVQGPKALCELQAYVYAAWVRMAEIYDALGDAAAAVRLRGKAQTLFDRFNAEFWDEEMGFYVFGLDGAKRKIRSVTSNVGHCLWTGLIHPDRARRVADRLMAPDMFSGWGVRTLAATHPAYNPFSYHNGSVWPHDNGIIALGLKRYGFGAEAARVARGINDAAGAFPGHQVPELFAGIDRVVAPFPVPYLGTNVPQAWAAGSAFALLQAMLGLEPDAPNRRLVIDPDLPDWLPDVTLRQLRLGRDSLDIRFWRDGPLTRHAVLSGDPGCVVSARV